MRQVQKTEDLLKDEFKQGRPNEQNLDIFEENLWRLELMLAAFEDELYDLTADPHFEALVESFENLLKFMIVLLKSFEDLLKLFRKLPPKFLRSFEFLLHNLEALLRSFEDLVNLLPPSPVFIASFEELLKGLKDLLSSFEELVKKHQPKEEEFIDSFDSLIDGFKDLLDSIKALKKRLPKATIPNDLKRSDVQLQAGLQDLQASKEKLLSGLKLPPSRDVEHLVDSLSSRAKMILDLIDMFSQGELPPGVLRDFRDVISRQETLIRPAQRLVKRVKARSPFLQDALEDVAWLQERLVERVRQLK